MRTMERGGGGCGWGGGCVSIRLLSWEWL